MASREDARIEGEPPTWLWQGWDNDGLLTSEGMVGIDERVLEMMEQS